MTVRQRFADYWSMIKSLQTGLLLFTGMAGYFSASCPVTPWQTFVGLTGSLFLSISGSTVLNMVYDRDIDRLMARSRHRPLPAGRLDPRRAAAVGLAMTAGGIAWAFLLAPLYGLVVAVGALSDVLIYTMWLKRRTPWSVVWGGIAGGMPALAGRVLGVGQIDGLGLLLALAVLLWIPTHILTYSSRHAGDYARAKVPVFPNVYGPKVTQHAIVASTALAVAAMLGATVLLAVPWGYMRAACFLGIALLTLAVASSVRPSPRLNQHLFKFASLYMLSSMGLVATGAWL